MCVTYAWDDYGETSDEENTCKGHNAADLTFWRGVYQDASGAFTLTRLSNEETRHAILPSTGAYSASYLYSDFGESTEVVELGTPQTDPKRPPHPTPADLTAHTPCPFT